MNDTVIRTCPFGKVQTGKYKRNCSRELAQTARDAVHVGGYRQLKDPEKAARQMRAAVVAIQKTADRFLKNDPDRQFKPRLIRDIAQTCLETVDERNLNSYKQVGAYQGALEAISALEEKPGSYAVEKAARQLLNGREAFYFDNRLKDEPHRLEKNREMLRMGLEAEKLVAQSLCHSGLIAVTQAALPTNAGLCAVEAAARHYTLSFSRETSCRQALDLNLVSEIAKRNLESKNFCIDGKARAAYMKDSLKIAEELSRLVGIQEGKPRRGGPGLVEKIAEKALNQEKCADRGHDPRLLKWGKTHKLDPWEQAGEYQGALEVIAAVGYVAVPPDLSLGAWRALKRRDNFGVWSYTVDRIYKGKKFDVWQDEQREEEYQQKTRLLQSRARDHYYQSAARSLGLMAEELSCPKALAVTEAGEPGEWTLHALKNISFEKPQKPRPQPEKPCKKEQTHDR